MLLTIVRHGETEENKKLIVQGQNHGELTRKGIAQVKKLARRLKKEHFDIIYCSDLKRTKDTCKEIIKYHKKTPVRYVKELRERSFGVFQGKSWCEMDDYMKKHNLDLGKWQPKGGESGPQKAARVLKFLKKTAKLHPNDSVLWVTHGGVKFSVLNSIFKFEGDRKKLLSSPNTAVSVIEIDKKNNHKVHTINCVKHL